MRKGQMMELIQRLIHDEAVNQLKKKKTRPVSPHDPPNMTDDELDLILFHGGMAKLSENFDATAKITNSDVTEFEQQMNDIVANIPNAVLTFDTQPNGHSILLKNSGDIISVVAQGKITFGNEGTLKWMFAIPNGFRIKTDDGLEITQANRDLISDMANYYDTWQKDWRQKMLAPDGGEGMEAENGGGGDSFKAPAGAPAQGGVQQPDAGTPQAAAPLGV